MLGKLLTSKKRKKMQILYVPQYSEKKMYYEINKIRKLKIVFCLLVFFKENVCLHTHESYKQGCQQI